MFAWASLGMVLISTFTFVLGTFPGNTSQKKDSPHYQDQHHHYDHLYRVPEGGGDRATPTLPRGRSSHGRCRCKPLIIIILNSFHCPPDFSLVCRQ